MSLASWSSTSMPPRPDIEAVAEEVFIALADPSRRGILAALAAGGPATATDLATRLPITRQAIAKHLALLADGGPGGRRTGRAAPGALPAPLRPHAGGATVPGRPGPGLGPPARCAPGPPRRRRRGSADAAERRRCMNTDDQRRAVTTAWTRPPEWLPDRRPATRSQDRNARGVGGRTRGAARPREGAHAGWATSWRASDAICRGSASRRSIASTPMTARARLRSSSMAAASCSSTTSCSARATRPATRSTRRSRTASTA